MSDVLKSAIIGLLGVIITALCSYLAVRSQTNKTNTEMFARLDKQSELADARIDAKIEKYAAAVDAKIEKYAAATDVKIENLATETRKHNSFAIRVPLIEQQIEAVSHRVDHIETKI